MTKTEDQSAQKNQCEKFLNLLNKSLFPETTDKISIQGFDQDFIIIDDNSAKLLQEILLPNNLKKIHHQILQKEALHIYDNDHTHSPMIIKVNNENAINYKQLFGYLDKIWNGYVELHNGTKIHPFHLHKKGEPKSPHSVDKQCSVSTPEKCEKPVLVGYEDNHGKCIIDHIVGMASLENALHVVAIGCCMLPKLYDIITPVLGDMAEHVSGYICDT